MDIDEADLQQLFFMLDEDGTGSISPDEFKYALSRWLNESKTATRFVKYNVMRLTSNYQELHYLMKSLSKKVDKMNDQVLRKISSSPFSSESHVPTPITSARAASPRTASQTSSQSSAADGLSLNLGKIQKEQSRNLSKSKNSSEITAADSTSKHEQCEDQQVCPFLKLQVNGKTNHMSSSTEQHGLMMMLFEAAAEKVQESLADALREMNDVLRKCSDISPSDVAVGLDSLESLDPLDRIKPKERDTKLTDPEEKELSQQTLKAEHEPFMSAESLSTQPPGSGFSAGDCGADDAGLCNDASARASADEEKQELSASSQVKSSIVVEPLLAEPLVAQTLLARLRQAQHQDMAQPGKLLRSYSSFGPDAAPVSTASMPPEIACHDSASPPSRPAMAMSAAAAPQQTLPKSDSNNLCSTTSAIP
eukprot:TRINITY_DN110018_c0_g1_i1.p1 TRINITY_DN110018_c0_g1~~TRINITY_DN110018_c0_g1_i1.p1  ORF type:complete len:487 (+),score=109.70 TRINITY_DN110018_c0_g1_i1:196-1461(+)